MDARTLATAALAPRKTKSVMRAAPRPNTCVYLGEQLNKGCGAMVFACTKHNCKTTRHTKCSTAERHCATCPDFQTNLNILTLGNMLERQMHPNELLLIESKRTEFPHYSAAGGDGVVYVGGGKYWPMITAGIRMLRASSSALPVEVWYRGGEETVYPSDVEGLNVRLVDSNAVASLRGVPLIPAGRDGGWANKLFALYHTEFSRVLFLDADAYLVRDPSPLFALLDTGAPFQYWRDLPSQTNAVKWKRVYPEGERANIPPVQGGQLLIDRTRAARLIHTARHMCDNAAHFFKHMYGDQDTWRVALALGCSTFNLIGQAHWREGVAFYCGLEGDSAPYIIHRCQGKLFAPQDIPAGKVKYTNPQYAIPREAELFGYFAEVVNKRPLPDTDIFNVIYSRQLWGKGSGAGSSAKEARPVVEFVNSLIGSNRYEKLIDAGCGDGFVGTLYAAQQYVGYDVSTDAIARCRKKYPGKTYVHLDIMAESAILECGDILVCKDVLHHQPNARVSAFVRRLIESKRHKCLVFVYDSRAAIDGADCHAGGYRALSATGSVLGAFGFDTVRQVLHKEIAVKFLDGGT